MTTKSYCIIGIKTTVRRIYMKKVLILLTLGLILLVNNAIAQDKPLRELLVNSNNTIDVIPVDSCTTYIHQKTYAMKSSSIYESDLSSELVRWCEKLGGKFQASSEDGKDWREIKLNSDMKFTSPFDGRVYKFSTAYITEHYRCDGVFSVVKTYEKPIARFLYKNMAPATAFVIKHDSQPFLFKFKNKDMEKTMKRLIDASSFPAEGSNPIELFAHRDFMIGTTSYQTVFVYMQGLCSIYEGNPKNLIERNDILYEAAPLETFDYLAAADKKWIFLCEGGKTPTGRFMTRIDDRRRFRVKGEFTSRPLVEGLNYIPLKKNAD